MAFSIDGRILPEHFIFGSWTVYLDLFRGVIVVKKLKKTKKHEEQAHKPIEMLELVHGEIIKILKLNEHEATTTASDRLTQLRWKVEKYLVINKM